MGAQGIAVGSSHACAVMADESALCWGRGDAGQLGAGFPRANSPWALPVLDAQGPLKGVRQLAAGDIHTCADLSDERVVCWGLDMDGWGGDFWQPSARGREVSTPTPVPTAGLVGVEAVSMAGERACAILTGRDVYCWTVDKPEPAWLFGTANAVSISTSNRHTCIALSNGTVRCWGDGSSGQLGNGLYADSTVPVMVQGITNATQVAVGYSFSCARTSVGEVWCWGYNGYGQLGNGDASMLRSPTPVQVPLSNVLEVRTGGSFACARALTAGISQVYCWGSNRRGQLGDGSTTDAASPVQVSGLSNVLSLAAGYEHTCAVTASAAGVPVGQVYCWGHDYYFALGNTTVSDHSAVPVLVEGAVGGLAMRVQAAGYVSCALLATGKRVCWGGNNDLGPAFGHPTATVVMPEWDGVPVFAVGPYNLCAATGPDQLLSCVGNGGYGLLGDGESQYVSRAIESGFGRVHIAPVQLPQPDSGDIPDNGSQLTLNFDVQDVVAPVESVSLTVEGMHGDEYQLWLSLTAPNGTNSLVLDHADASGTKNNAFWGHYRFDDGSTNKNWSAATADVGLVASGAYQATDGLSKLSLNQVFGGLSAADAQGTWTLSVIDTVPGVTGKITRAWLTVREVPSPLLFKDGFED